MTAKPSMHPLAPSSRPEAPPPRDPMRTTTLAFVGLLLLWGASWLLSYLSEGPWSLTIALAIAALKAALVLAVFMELARETISIRIAATTGAVLIALLLAFSTLDLLTRAPPPLEAHVPGALVGSRPPGAADAIPHDP